MRKSTIKPLDVRNLRQNCDASLFDFQTTDDLPDLPEFVGQNRALTAATFGIKIKSDGFNIFALGPVGVGKRLIIRALLAKEALSKPEPKDICYIHNFGSQGIPRF